MRPRTRSAPKPLWESMHDPRVRCSRASRIQCPSATTTVRAKNIDHHACSHAASRSTRSHRLALLHVQREAAHGTSGCSSPEHRGYLRAGGFQVITVRPMASAAGALLGPIGDSDTHHIRPRLGRRRGGNRAGDARPCRKRDHLEAGQRPGGARLRTSGRLQLAGGRPRLPGLDGDRPRPPARGRSPRQGSCSPSRAPGAGLARTAAAQDRNGWPGPPSN